MVASDAVAGGEFAAFCLPKIKGDMKTLVCKKIHYSRQSLTNAE